MQKSQKISGAGSNKQYGYLQASSNIQRYIEKQTGDFPLEVQASLSQVTSENITENLRRYKGSQHTNKFISCLKKTLQVRAPLLGRSRGRFPLGALPLAVLAASSQVTSKNIKENLRRYKGYQLTNEFILFDILKFSEIYREAVRSFPTCSVGLLVASDIQEYRRKSQKT